jgi:hypothetical protein
MKSVPASTSASSRLPHSLVDRLEEILPERGRAVVIHAHHDITLGREDLVVPAEVEVVMPRRVRAAMDVVQQRPLLRGVEVGRIYSPHLHFLALPSLDAEFAHLAHLASHEDVVVEPVDARFALAAVPEDRGWRAHRAAHEGETAGAHCEVGDRAAPGDGLRRLRADGKAIDALPRVFLGAEEQCRRIRVPLERRVNAAIPASRLDLQGAGTPIDERDAIRIDGAAAQVLREDRDEPAVGRIGGALVRQARGRSEVLHAARGEVERADVRVLVEALLRRGIEGEGDLAAVGRDVVVVRGRIGARQLPRAVAEEVARLAAFHVHHEEVRHAAVGNPVVPPADRRRARRRAP